MPWPTLSADIAPEYWLFGAAGLVSVVAFAVLVLVPALGSYGRTWEKFAASVVSMFILVALIVLGIGAGVAIVYFWDDITGVF